jgi:hypothetical protein
MGEVVTAGSPRHRVPVSCNPVDHPVVSAWRRLAPARMRIDGVDLLRKKEKSAVYRLSLDNGATRVIAKRGWRERLLVERTIYESVLPHLAVPALRSYGFVGEEDEELAWLFIEDAGDVLFSLAQHETLVGRWLGALHGGAAALDPAPSLPERGPGHYLEHLDAVRTKILGNFDNPALRADDRGMLQRLVSACELIESNWSGVEKICDGLPRTLVHGDLGRKNLRLRHDEAGTAIVAFDWECSGWVSRLPTSTCFETSRVRPSLLIARRCRSTRMPSMTTRYDCSCSWRRGSGFLPARTGPAAISRIFSPRQGWRPCTCMSNRCGNGARGWPRPILSAGERQCPVTWPKMGPHPGAARRHPESPGERQSG